MSHVTNVHVNSVNRQCMQCNEGWVIKNRALVMVRVIIALGDG